VNEPRYMSGADTRATPTARRRVFTRIPWSVPKLQRLVHWRDLVRELVGRDLKVRYKRSWLGFAWALANPLLYLTVFYFVFQMALSLNIPRYGLFAFSGMLAWSWFQSSLSQACSAITQSRELIRLPGFVPAVLPIVSVVTNLIHFLLALVLLILYLVLDGTGLRYSMALLPFLIALQFVLTMGLAFLVATANVLFRDTQHLVVVSLQLFFFLTPIFYDASIVPARYQPFYRLNPMVHLVEAYRAVLLGTEPPSETALLVLAVVAAGLLYGGYKIFVRVSHRFVEEL